MAQQIKTGKYEGPEGPYRNLWTSGAMFLVLTPEGYRTVLNGEQPSTGTLHANLRDARTWLRENGFSLNSEVER